jgi:hypothetical protein
LQQLASSKDAEAAALVAAARANMQQMVDDAIALREEHLANYQKVA